MFSLNVLKYYAYMYIAFCIKKRFKVNEFFNLFPLSHGTFKTKQTMKIKEFIDQYVYPYRYIYSPILTLPVPLGLTSISYMHPFSIKLELIKHPNTFEYCYHLYYQITAPRDQTLPTQ